MLMLLMLDARSKTNKELLFDTCTHIVDWRLEISSRIVLCASTMSQDAMLRCVRRVGLLRVDFLLSLEAPPSGFLLLCSHRAPRRARSISTIHGSASTALQSINSNRKHARFTTLQLSQARIYADFMNIFVHFYIKNKK